MSERFEYKTVDVPAHKGRLLIDVTISLMAQEGWSPMVLISPQNNYPHNSVVFEKEVSRYE